MTSQQTNRKCIRNAKINTNLQRNTPLTRMQPRSPPVPNRPDKNLQKLRPMDRQLLPTSSPIILLLLQQRDGVDLAAVVVPAKRDPDIVPVARDGAHVVEQADAVEKPGRVDGEAQASPNFFVFGGLLVDVDVDAIIIIIIVVVVVVSYIWSCV